MLNHPLLAQLRSRDLLALFDQLSEVYLFIKDRAHRFVRVNPAFVKLHGCSHQADVVGKTDFDFHPPALAEQYQAEDRKVMEQRQPLIDQVWLVPRFDGTPLWYFCTKQPLVSPRGRVMGLAGFLRPHHEAGQASGEYARLAQVFDFVHKQFGQPITVAEMAQQVDLSVSQLQRDFAKLFGITPKGYLLRVRLSMAQHALLHTNKPIGDIALECGFYDQSHFNRTFRTATGQSPRSFQLQFRDGSSANPGRE